VGHFVDSGVYNTKKVDGGDVLGAKQNVINGAENWGWGSDRCYPAALFGYSTGMMYLVSSD